MSATKTVESTINILKLMFFTINLHFCQIKPNITKQHLFCLLTPRNAKKTRTDQSIPIVCLLSEKKNEPRIFRSGSCKNPFLQCVRYWHNLLRLMFFILVITGRHYFSWKFIVTLRLLKRHVAAFFYLLEVCILCVISMWC